MGARASSAASKKKTGGRVERGKNRVQKYHVRIRYQGAFDFVCPMCGHIDKYYVNIKRYYFVCTGRGCGAKFVMGFRPLLMTGGGGPRNRIPADFIIPDLDGAGALQEAFPQGDIGRWKYGGCTHEVVGQDDRAKEFVDEVTRRTWDDDNATIGAVFRVVAAEWGY